jgi:excisionase family DNA binding protein
MSRSHSAVRVRPAAAERLAFPVSEAAALCGVSESTMRVLLRTGKIQSRRITSRLTLVPRSSIEGFLAGSEGE